MSFESRLKIFKNMADEEQKKNEEETTEDAEHKFDPDSDACGACGGCGLPATPQSGVAMAGGEE